MPAGINQAPHAILLLYYLPINLRNKELFFFTDALFSHLLS